MTHKEGPRHDKKGSATDVCAGSRSGPLRSAPAMREGALTAFLGVCACHCLLPTAASLDQSPQVAIVSPPIRVRHGICKRLLQQLLQQLLEQHLLSGSTLCLYDARAEPRARNRFSMSTSMLPAQDSLSDADFYEEALSASEAQVSRSL